MHNSGAPKVDDNSSLTAEEPVRFTEFFAELERQAEERNIREAACWDRLEDKVDKVQEATDELLGRGSNLSSTENNGSALSVAAPPIDIRRSEYHCP